jgi:XTP/dITP diphosphohydrolase
MTSPTQLLLATSNPHKLAEFRSIVDTLGRDISVIGLGDLPAEGIDEPIEDGATFEDNARIKAIGYARQTGRWCVADDSGLEVDALNGEPGVNSARYSGVDGSRETRDSANNAKLLEELANLPDEQRTARFVCVMALAIPDTGVPDGARVAAVTKGAYEGRIGHEARGANGFGYDPLLVLEDGRTSAELSPEEKNARSHRGVASREMMERIEGMWDDLVMG